MVVTNDENLFDKFKKFGTMEESTPPRINELGYKYKMSISFKPLLVLGN